MAVLPLRSTGQVRGFHTCLLLAQSISPRTKEQTNQVGWEERRRNTSLAAMAFGGDPLSAAAAVQADTSSNASPLEERDTRRIRTACSNYSAGTKSGPDVQQDPSGLKSSYKARQVRNGRQFVSAFPLLPATGYVMCSAVLSMHEGA